MTTIAFIACAGQSVAFTPSDVLLFGGQYGASGIGLQADGTDTIVTAGGQWVRLVGASYNSLANANFSFYNGSVARLGTSASDTLTGTGFGDFIDIGARRRGQRHHQRRRR